MLYDIALTRRLACESNGHAGIEPVSFDGTPSLAPRPRPVASAQFEAPGGPQPHDARTNAPHSPAPSLPEQRCALQRAWGAPNQQHTAGLRRSAVCLHQLRRLHHHTPVHVALMQPGADFATRLSGHWQHQQPANQHFEGGAARWRAPCWQATMYMLCNCVQSRRSTGTLHANPLRPASPACNQREIEMLLPCGMQAPQAQANCTTEVQEVYKERVGLNVQMPCSSNMLRGQRKQETSCGNERQEVGTLNQVQYLRWRWVVDEQLNAGPERLSCAYWAPLVVPVSSASAATPGWRWQQHCRVSEPLGLGRAHTCGEPVGPPQH
jgi:hypothetical protein